MTSEAEIAEKAAATEGQSFCSECGEPQCEHSPHSELADLQAQLQRAREEMRGRVKRPIPGLDAEITVMVETLREYGVETFESCEGGAGHSYPEPTVRFHGQPEEGFRAYAAAMERGLPVKDVRRIWTVVDGELTGPYWEMTFRDPIMTRNQTKRVAEAQAKEK